MNISFFLERFDSPASRKAREGTLGETFLGSVEICMRDVRRCTRVCVQFA